MSYIRNPFNPTSPYANQVVIELNRANTNFDILAQAFVGDNPSTKKVKDADKVDGYHASPSPAPYTIPVAGADGKLSPAWLPSSRGYRIVPLWIERSSFSGSSTRVNYDVFVYLHTTPFSNTSGAVYSVEISQDGTNWYPVYYVRYTYVSGSTYYYNNGLSCSFFVPKDWYFRSNLSWNEVIYVPIGIGPA